MRRNALAGWGGMVAAVAIVAGCSQSKNQAATSVTWHRSYDAALADAGKSGRPILLDFYTDW